jgi:hypothetical protein
MPTITCRDPGTLSWVVKVTEGDARLAGGILRSADNVAFVADT